MYGAVFEEGALEKWLLDHKVSIHEDERGIPLDLRRRRASLDEDQLFRFVVRFRGATK